VLSSYKLIKEVKMKNNNVTKGGVEMKKEQAYLSVAEVAKKIGVCQETIRRWCRAGKIDGFKLGRDWFFYSKFEIPTFIRKAKKIFLTKQQDK